MLLQQSRRNGKHNQCLSLSNDIKARDAKVEGYYVLRNIQMPAVLVEMGFLSNYSERQKLLSDDYQEILSQRIAEGILQELMNSKKVVVNWIWIVNGCYALFAVVEPVVELEKIPF